MCRDVEAEEDVAMHHKALLPRRPLSAEHEALVAYGATRIHRRTVLHKIFLVPTGTLALLLHLGA
jgi:hypothetical protein